MIQSENLKDIFSHSVFFLIKKEEYETQEVQDFIKKIQIPAEKIKNPERQKEYVLGRYCAHIAHKKLTNEDLLILESNDDRSPRWPESVVGSITHNQDYACCALAFKKNLQGIGLDAEIFGRTKIELARQIRVDKDLQFHPEMTEQELLTFIFSAKESLYKTLYPIVGKFFGFDHAYISEINSADHTFKIHLQKSLNDVFSPGARGDFEGKFALLGNSLFTVIELIKR
jgi:4'-phosphopantetheinyl transferase EntD